MPAWGVDHRAVGQDRHTWFGGWRLMAEPCPRTNWPQCRLHQGSPTWLRNGLRVSRRRPSRSSSSATAYVTTALDHRTSPPYVTTAYVTTVRHDRTSAPTSAQSVSTGGDWSSWRAARTKPPLSTTATNGFMAGRRCMLFPMQDYSLGWCSNFHGNPPA